MMNLSLAKRTSLILYTRDGPGHCMKTSIRPFLATTRRRRQDALRALGPGAAPPAADNHPRHMGKGEEALRVPEDFPRKLLN